MWSKLYFPKCTLPRKQLHIASSICICDVPNEHSVKNLPNKHLVSTGPNHKLKTKLD